jgi:hypothetical protein
MIQYIFLSIFGLSFATGTFIYLSVWGTKILYAEKLKDLYKNKNELIKIMKLKLLDLELELKQDEDEYINLKLLLNELTNM